MSDVTFYEIFLFGSVDSISSETLVLHFRRKFSNPLSQELSSNYYLPSKKLPTIWVNKQAILEF